MLCANPDIESKLSEEVEGGCITPCADDDAANGSGLVCVGASCGDQGAGSEFGE